MKSNYSLNMLKYMQWADKKIFDIISELSEDEVAQDLGRNMNSMRDRLLHLAEEHLSWFYEVTGADWKEIYPQITTKNISGLIAFINEYHEKWLTFFSTSETSEFTFDQGEGLLVEMSPEEVIFNITNHSTYHRGQIMTCLRAFDRKGIITDYKFYKIAQLQGSTEN